MFFSGARVTVAELLEDIRQAVKQADMAVVVDRDKDRREAGLMVGDACLTCSPFYLLVSDSKCCVQTYYEQRAAMFHEMTYTRTSTHHYIQRPGSITSADV